MATTTTNLGLTLPTPNVDTGWGSTLNTDFTLIDNIFSPTGAGTSIGVNVGSGKVLLLGGTMLLGTGDASGSVAAPTIRGPARTGTNAGGVDLTIDASNGTGTAGSGNFIFRTAPAGSAGTVANTLQSALKIGKGSDTYLIDLGAGGTASTGAASAVRLNGSSAGVGTAGGSALYISNNGVNTAAFGNRGNIFGASTAYDSSATVWGSSSIGFIVGSGSLAASNEKLRIGSSGQLSVWDTTLGTPALNPGVAGQVLTSGGPSAAPTWSTPGINTVAAQTFTASGNSFTGLSAGIKTIEMNISTLNPTDDVLIQLGTSSGYTATGYGSSSSTMGSSTVTTSSNTTGFFVKLLGSTHSGIVKITNVTGNTWVCTHTLGSSTTTRTCSGGGIVTLSGTLERIQIIPSAGSFAASGSVSLTYQ